MIENINLEWIKAFVYFAESSGIEETAAKLNVTQPAVTQHLNKLDAVLPTSLFERQGKRKVLSAFGHEFYKGLCGELRSIDDLLRISKYGKAKESDVVIRLGINNEIYYRICDKIDFGGQLEVHNQRSPVALASLLRREVDIAVCRIVPDSSDIISVKWYSDTFVVAYPKAWQRQIDSEGLNSALQKKRFILNVESKPLVEDVLMAMDITPEKLQYGHKLSDWLSVLKLVREGKGWAIIPSSFESNPKIQTATINSRTIPKTQFYILYHRAVRNFLGFQDLLASMLASMK